MVVLDHILGLENFSEMCCMFEQRLCLIEHSLLTCLLMLLYSLVLTSSDITLFSHGSTYIQSSNFLFFVTYQNNIVTWTSLMTCSKHLSELELLIFKNNPPLFVSLNVAARQSSSFKWLNEDLIDLFCSSAECVD